MSARKKAEKRDRNEERERERKKETFRRLFLPFSLSLFISISLLRLFSRAHYWVNKYFLKMRVSSKELFSLVCVELYKRRKREIEGDRRRQHSLAAEWSFNEEGQTLADLGEGF